MCVASLRHPWNDCVRRSCYGDAAMGPLLLGLILAFQNGTQDPVVNKEFALALTPNVCAKREEILGSIDFFKTCGNEDFSISIRPGQADEVVVEVFYWDHGLAVRNCADKNGAP